MGKMGRPQGPTTLRQIKQELITVSHLYNNSEFTLFIDYVTFLIELILRYWWWCYTPVTDTWVKICFMIILFLFSIFIRLVIACWFDWIFLVWWSDFSLIFWSIYWWSFPIFSTNFPIPNKPIPREFICDTRRFFMGNADQV